MLAPGRYKWNERSVVFKLVLAIDCWGIAYEIALKWMSLDLAHNESTLDQVMTWCRQAKAIAWASVDLYLCRHKASQGNNVLVY